MSNVNTALESVVIRFAGDSGDGMQLTGNQFTNTTALLGNDLATFPDFPAEIRAPIGTLAGVSGFQIHFGSQKINTPGDTCDVLVVMNAAALKSNIKNLKPRGTIIANTDGFDAKNLRLANIPAEKNPIEDDSLADYDVKLIDVTKLTRAALADSGLGTKETDRSKNMFVLGLLYWIYNRPMENTIEFLKGKFGKKPDILDANIKVLKAGYHYGETTEVFHDRYEIHPAKLDPGVYRSITGNQAAAYGLVAAGVKSGLDVFLGAYPITPASDILHELSKHKNFGVRTFQAEDEIAAITAAIGAAFGGSLAVTTSSGPGIALKSEAIGLDVVLELPLVICNIQRGGPSTGLPTKTEQADLMQALYGRNGEAPCVVIAASTPSNCFDMAYEACKIALEHMVPVFFLSDGYIANGAEPWKFPQSSDIEDIKIKFVTQADYNEENKFQPYSRDKDLVRPWAIPGTKGLEHRVGGLEKEHITGNVSYDPDNHEFMVKLRQEKIDRIANYIPDLEVTQGNKKGKMLVLGWGSTYGVIKTAVGNAIKNGWDVSQAHLHYLNPMPSNLEEVLRSFDTVIIPEMNNGQLVKIIREKFLIDAKPVNKIQGQPFTTIELVAKIEEYLG